MSKLSAEEPPIITVLLATYNGRRWLPDQVASILDQRDVSVSVIALDDGSTDGTLEWLVEFAAQDSRLSVLPSDIPSGSAAANFFRLLQRAPLDGAEFVALSDQDDLWMPDKLARHASILRSGTAQGVSSSITSFDASGRRTFIRKSYPQREFDFLTESPGPGSTFLMTQHVVSVVRGVLDNDLDALRADYHDSLIYAVARAAALPWHIDFTSTVDYRQHDHNVMGANVGGRSAVSRFRLISSKWHRSQAVLHARAGLSVATDETRPGLQRMLELMTTTGLPARLRLARRGTSLRRRPRDGVIISALIALGIW